MAQKKPAKKTTAPRSSGTRARKKPTAAAASPAPAPSAPAPKRHAVPVFQFEGSPARADGAGALQFHDVKATVKASFTPGTARAVGPTEKVTVLSNDIIEIEFDDGIRLWMSGDDYQEQFLKGTSRDVRAGGSVAPPAMLQVLPAGMQSRGPIGWAVKALRVFGIDLGEKTALKIATSVDTRPTKSRAAPGFYACSVASETFALTKPAADLGKDGKPILVFLHGTASSTRGSFGELWSKGRERERIELANLYGNRVTALEHASLSQSPIENARDLVRELPKGARLHVVSHSRGGLVGELLCRANRVSGMPFDSVEMEAYGLSLDARAKELKEPSAKDRHLAALQELNDLLRQKQIVVERFVRVACPALGTTLASRRLDRWLSVIGSICSAAMPETPLSDWLSDIGDFIGSVISEKTDPATLPGLEAMMPDSGLIRLVNWPEAEVGGDLAVIAGDIAPDAWWTKLLVWVTDRFYDGEHDLVVNTASMSGGAKRTEQALLSFHQGPKVNHFSYFQNADSAGRLVIALRGEASLETGFKPMLPPAAPIARALVIKPRPGPRPVVFLLPGIMGSELMVNNGTVWINMPKLAFGGLAKLSIGTSGIKPRQPVVRYYGDLSLYLGNSHKVIDFAYDWRLPPEEEAARLAKAVAAELESEENAGMPVRLLAHSMGGLVARTMIANHPKVWLDLCKRSGGRLVMLGTPNGGSHAITEMFVGQSSTMKGLSVLDVKHSPKELLQIVSRFPGVLSMMPKPDKDDPENYFDPSVWAKYAAHSGDKWVPPPADGLARARRFRDTMDRALVDPEHMVYVAGIADATPAGLRLDAEGNIEVVATTQGDGRVTWDSGIPPGVPTWFMNAEHGDLSAHAPAFPAIQELLETGKTTKLAVAPKVSRGPVELFRMPRDTDALYPSEEILTATMLGARPRKRGTTKPAEMPVNVSVLNADLAYAKYPVVVGHYTGDTIISAEGALDRSLGGALMKRHRLGHYPGPIGTGAAFTNPRLASDATASPRGAIVIGLGTAGQLTSSTLARAFQHGLLEHVLAAIQTRAAQGMRGSVPGTTVRLPVSVLLIGTGAGGISVADSVYALLRGVIAANEMLAQSQQLERITDVEILELYEDIAIQAVKALKDASRQPDIGTAFQAQETLSYSTGWRRRVSFEESAGWWHRVQILGGGKEGQPADGTLRFSAITRRARTEVQLQRTQRALVDKFVEQSVRTTTDNANVACTLFELLLPNELKDQAPDQDDIVLLVDDESAHYPWELLRDPFNKNGKPMVIEHGVLRQLESFTYRETIRYADENTAFVVGDPASDFPALPGARHEAEVVAQLLRENGTIVEALIRPEASEVLQSLFKQPYRILHLAGHGVYQFLRQDQIDCDACGQPLSAESLEKTHAPAERITGMVIGNESFLTPVEVRQMRRVPELVFINCCHLGNIEAAPEHVRARAQHHDHHKIAANVATEFIRMGVRAVIAAGWAVDDAAASIFAKHFYQEMLQGERFGKAVLKARRAAYNEAPGINTWGAYQCYGDPDFQIVRNRSPEAARAQPDPFVSRSEAVAELDNLKARLGKGAEDSGRYREALKGLVKRLQDQGWLSDPEILAALGRAYSESNQFDSAIEYLRRALQVDDSLVSFKDVETLANLEARQALRIWRERQAPEAIPLIDTAIGRLKALVRVAEPDGPASDRSLAKSGGATRERLSLLGSAYKRKALMTTGPTQTGLLQESLACYRSAYARDGNAYPLVNALMLELILGWKSARGSSVSARAGLNTEARTLATTMMAATANQRDFWTASLLADATFVEVLTRPGFESAAIDGVRDRYLEARQRGSPREFRSVIDQLDVLIGMAASQADVVKALQQLRGSLDTEQTDKTPAARPAARAPRRRDSPRSKRK